MTPERWQQIEVLYHLALEKEPSQRSAFLDGACRGDQELRREVESLLGQSSSMLDHPAWEAAPSLEDATRRTLTPGAQLGPYKIETLLGAGGMGEVFRARDSRLNRDVALKVLPRHLSDGTARRGLAIRVGDVGRAVTILLEQGLIQRVVTRVTVVGAGTAAQCTKAKNSPAVVSPRG